MSASFFSNRYIKMILAVVLAPFFVHLELLFGAGYRPELHKRVQNDVGKELTKIRKEAAEKKRASEKKGI